MNLQYSFNFRIMLSFIPQTLMGFVNTLRFGLLGLVLALIFGTMLALGQVSHYKILKSIISMFISFIRSTPLLVQTYFLYFGLSEWRIYLSEHTVGLMALVLNSGAYSAEIIRAGIESIHKIQYDAADSLAMSYGQKMRYIILPQTFKNILPPLMGQATILIKDTSIISVLGIYELTKVASTLQANSFRPIESYIPAMCMYLILILSLINLSRKLENVLRKYE